MKRGNIILSPKLAFTIGRPILKKRFQIKGRAKEILNFDITFTHQCFMLERG
jgi:hypothetical protein